jgi:hypothetical protein
MDGGKDKADAPSAVKNTRVIAVGVAGLDRELDFVISGSTGI